MLKCDSCGKRIQDDERLCPYCGRSILSKAELEQKPGINRQLSVNSTLGILAFCLSLSLSGIAGLILGIIDIKKNEEYKHNSSIAAIVISIVRLITIALAVIIISTSNNSGGTNLIFKDDNTQETISESVTNVSIVLPETPVTINQYSIDGSKVEIVSKITDISYTLEDKDYNDKVWAGFTFTLEMIENKSVKSSTKVFVVYTILNSSGDIVETGNVVVGPISVGEKMQETFKLLKLTRNELYTLILEDYTY